MFRSDSLSFVKHHLVFLFSHFFREYLLIKLLEFRYQQGAFTVISIQTAERSKVFITRLQTPSVDGSDFKLTLVVIEKCLIPCVFLISVNQDEEVVTVFG